MLTDNQERDFAPVWSPDGRRIAFERLFASGAPQTEWVHLYVMSSDGSGQRNPTRSLGDPFPRRLGGQTLFGAHPRWSPDGRKIAFLSDRDGDLDVYVMNPDGSRPRNLTRNEAPDFSPAWSPDGERIAFTRGHDGTSKVYVMNTDGSSQRRLTQSGAQPLWSPDGRKVAFVSDRDGNYEVYIMNADGSGQRNLTRNPAKDDCCLAWSSALEK